MTIPALPDAPALGDSPEQFNAKAFAFVAALDDWGTAANETAVAVDADAASADADAATATTQAGIATAAAGTATTQAGIATTKAGEAATSANMADASADAANLSAIDAAASAASIDPDTLVKLTGDQTVAGVKTFTNDLFAAGNLKLTGLGNRITGDFSNATASSRVAFQSSTSNGNTIVQSLPNGTGISSSYYLWNASDLNNSGVLIVSNSSAVGVSINSFKTGTGSYQPISISTGGSERINIGATGGIKWLQQNEGAFAAGEWSRNSSWGTYYKAPASGTTADIAFVSQNGTIGWKISNDGAGYTSNIGSGGTVTQATSKGTTVTLNKPSGRVTTNNGALAANTAVAFVVNNSVVAVTDNVVCNCVGGTGDVNAYIATAFPFTGGFYISLRNLSAGSLSEAIQIQFSVIKGATA